MCQSMCNENHILGICIFKELNKFLILLVFLGLILMGEKKNEHFMLSLLTAMPGELNCQGKCFPWANSLTRGGPAAEISLCWAYAVVLGLGSYLSTAATAAS